MQKRVDALIERIIVNPVVGKPLRYERFGTRELYVPPFRLSYAYEKATHTVTFLALYHKDEQ